MSRVRCAEHGSFLHSRFIDPALEHNLTSQTKPWALSPLIATVPHFVHSRIENKVAEEEEDGVFPPSTSISDDTSHLSIISAPPSDDSHDETTSKSDPTALRFRTSGERRKYFSKQANRKDLMFGPAVRFSNPYFVSRCKHAVAQDLISIDFCYGFLEFNPKLVLRLPGGITFDLMKYWDKQPVRFVCCERKESLNGKGDSDSPIGKLVWCVSIELAEDENEEHAAGDADVD